jgi:asparagine synthase (glutamine-hydrolysing)
MTDRLGLPFHPVRFGWNTLVDELDYDLSQFEFLVWLMETPRFNVEWLMKHELHRFARTQVPGIKVMLLGQGADEFAGGYSLSEGTQRSWAQYIDHLRSAVRREEYAAMGVPARLLPFVTTAREPARGGREFSFFSEMRRRVFSLQRYNLWHEDRTASAQGIESRVPFLDHRLVELLVSVPAELHEGLFYNKHIVRRQLARHLPDYPAEKLKVRFTATGSEITPYRMLQRVLRKIYPAFRNKYLLKGNAIFSDARLSGLAVRATGSGRVLKREVDFVFECMAIAIFDDLCRNLIWRGAPAGVDPPSPLRPASARDLKVGAG